MHHHVKPPVDPAALEHRNLRQGEFWREVPKYEHVDEKTFLDHIWQGKNSVKTTEELFETIGAIVDPTFLEDAKEGFRRAPMAVRVSPYMIAAIDWTRPYEDPIRRQFIPVASRLLPDHPRLTLDSLHEQDDAPVQGLTHRYVDKALFLPLQTCPVYCRFCTRSYAIGPDTENVDKAALAKTTDLWKQAFAYIASRPEIEDIVISGGDTYQLVAEEHHADRRVAAGDPARAAHALRDQRPGRDADEDPHRPRLDRRADRRRRARAARSARTWCCTRTSTRPTRSRGSRSRRWTCCSGAASRCATRAC